MSSLEEFHQRGVVVGRIRKLVIIVGIEQSACDRSSSEPL